MIRSLDRSADRDEWLRAWELTGREPFAHPDFVALFATEAETTFALLHTDGDATALLPLVGRPLPVELGEGSDAVSPYGYGGPFGHGPVDWSRCYGEMLDWLRGAETVSVFVRASLEHPAGEVEVPGVRAVALAPNVRVDLSRSDEEQWRHVAHKVRKNVNKARRAGLSVRVGEGFTDLDAFLAVYESTMRRRDAAERYLFDADFFAAIDALPGCCLVADVLDETGKVVSTELVLMSERRLYSFLGGTLAEAFAHAPNDLLKFTVMQEGHRRELEHYVLGGGYQPGDGIYRYKQSFDVDGVVDFHGVQLIPDQARYDALCRRAGGSSDDDFFPRYRRPATPAQ